MKKVILLQCFLFTLLLTIQTTVAQQMVLGNEGEIFVNINNDHRTENEGKIIINNDHRTENQGKIIINNDHRILKLNPSGEIITSWNIAYPVQDMAVSSNGNLYVLLRGIQKIQCYSSDGKLLRTIPLEGEATAICINQENDILVNINNNHRILQLDFDGNQLNTYSY